MSDLTVIEQARRNVPLYVSGCLVKEYEDEDKLFILEDVSHPSVEIIFNARSGRINFNQDGDYMPQVMIYSSGKELQLTHDDECPGCWEGELENKDASLLHNILLNKFKKGV